MEAEPFGPFVPCLARRPERDTGTLKAPPEVVNLAHVVVNQRSELRFNVECPDMQAVTVISWLLLQDDVTGDPSFHHPQIERCLIGFDRVIGIFRNPLTL